MKPIPFEGQNVVFAENQKEYEPLPAHRTEDGIVTSCWELSKEDLAKINETGKLYVCQMTFNKPLQPINVFTEFTFLTEDELQEEEDLNT